MVIRIQSCLCATVLLAMVAASGPVAPAASVALSRPADVLTTSSMAEPAPAQALAGVSLSPPQVTVPVDEPFVLAVLVDCGTHADAAAVQVTFDPRYMEVVSVDQDAAVFPEVLRNRFDNASGVVYYDAGSLLCHSQGSCPAGVIRVATITFRATAGTLPSKNVQIYGQVTWAGDYTFDGQGSGSTITITTTVPVSSVYLPLLLRGPAF